MKQQTFASQSSFEKYGRKSRRELFLDEMEMVVRWAELQALVEPHYPKAGNGRRPVGLSIMLRTYFMQQWFNLSDPGVEEAFYESRTLRRFAGVDLGVAPAPDETTVLRFRHLLEKHDLCGAMLDTVNQHLRRRASVLRRARSSMRPLSMRLLRPRTQRRNAIRRCTRPRKATNGTSG
jgi:IS5 family transposase